jgi:hypothetical protein
MYSLAPVLNTLCEAGEAGDTSLVMHGGMADRDHEAMQKLKLEQDLRMARLDRKDVEQRDAVCAQLHACTHGCTRARMYARTHVGGREGRST